MIGSRKWLFRKWNWHRQQIAFNKLLSTCWKQLVACGNFLSTCWKQHVESNLLPAATFGQLLVNMLKATCWKQLVACGNFWATLVNMLKATCWKQLVACGNFRATFGKHVAFNKLLSTCCSCVAGFNVLSKIQSSVSRFKTFKKLQPCPKNATKSYRRIFDS